MLLHIESLTKAKGDPGVDLSRYEDEEGKEVTLRGANKCQCGLNVADLPHSCTLGHLHHLEADDGKIYNYLQYGDGKAAFLGDGTHFRNVEVKARVFPGQFCWSSAASSCRDRNRGPASIASTEVRGRPARDRA